MKSDQLGIETSSAPAAAAVPDMEAGAQPEPLLTVQEAPTPRSAERSARPCVIAIASGKGGVGKSVLAASIGIYLAQLTKRVILVDASLGAGNLHTLVGAEAAGPSLNQAISDSGQRLEDIVVETPFRGLGLVTGRRNGAGAANLPRAQLKRLLGQLHALPAEYVIVDCASGTGYNTLDTFLAADLHVVVTQPEPTAVEGAARLIKSAFCRSIQPLKGIQEIVQQADDGQQWGVPTPYRIRLAAERQDPRLAEAVFNAMDALRPLLIVNHTRTREDLELGAALALIARRHLGLAIEYLGHVESDDLVWTCVRKRRPLLVEQPEAKVSRDIERIARRLMAREARDRTVSDPLPRSLDDQNLYEILGVQPGATAEEIRRAHRHVRRLYDAGSIPTYGVVTGSELARVLERIEEASATLIDPERQQRYNQAIFPEGALDSTVGGQRELAAVIAAGGIGVELLADAAHAVPPAPLPEMPVIDEQTVYTGELLRQVREARGVELDELAERTKIAVSYLKGIEAEQLPSMLAPVYVRGFVKAVAKHLGLNVERAARSYMDRVKLGSSQPRA